MVALQFIILSLLAFAHTGIYVRSFQFRHRHAYTYGILKPTILQCQIGEANNVHATHSKGLLSGIDNITKAEYYSNNSSIKDSYELLKNPNQLYKICLQNSGGVITKLELDLKNISDKAEEFIQSDEVWNRKQLISSIENIVARKGKFACLLAGKNTGKSLVLSSIEKKLSAKVFIVDLRIHPNILTGLMSTLIRRKMFDITDELKKILFSTVSKFIIRVLDIKNIITEEDLQKYVDIVISKPDTVKSLTELIYELMNALGAITLVIDEANIALTVTEVTSEAKIDVTKQALALFTSLTKQTNKVTIPKHL